MAADQRRTARVNLNIAFHHLGGRSVQVQCLVELALILAVMVDIGIDIRIRRRRGRATTQARGDEMLDPGRGLTPFRLGVPFGTECLLVFQRA